MCLITAAPKGTKKRGKDLKSFIERGMSSNTDGSGFAYKRNGSNLIYLSKGYREVSKIVEAIDKAKLKPEDEIIIHHRIGTSGLANEYNMHPFAVSESESVLDITEGEINVPAMAHNGVFYKFTDRQSIHNDTYNFVQQFIGIPEITALLKRSPEKFKSLFDGILSTNKLAFLFPDKDMLLLGNFVEDSGYFHSNSGYKSYVFDHGGSSTAAASASSRYFSDFEELSDEDIERMYGYGPRQSSQLTLGQGSQGSGFSGVVYGSVAWLKQNGILLKPKFVWLSEHTQHHFKFIINRTISVNFPTDSVLSLTDYNDEALINWVINDSNNNTMTGLNIKKLINDGTLSVYVLPKFDYIYKGLSNLMFYIESRGRVTASLMKNINKALGVKSSRSKKDSDYIKFRDYGTIMKGNLKIIKANFEVSDVMRVIKSENDEPVITNSEIVEDTQS